MKFTGVIATSALLVAATNVNGDAPKPLINITYLKNLYTQIQTDPDMDMIFETVIAADNALKGFHNVMQLGGGPLKFEANFNSIMTVYYEQALATFMTGHVANDKMMETSALIQQVARLGVDILDNGLMGVVHDDLITPLTTAINASALPFNKTVVAIDQLLGNATIIYQLNQKRRMLRSDAEVVTASRVGNYNYSKAADVKADLCSTEPYLIELVDIGRSAMNETRIPTIDFFIQSFSGYALFNQLTDFLKYYEGLIKAGNISKTLDLVEDGTDLLHMFCHGEDALRQSQLTDMSFNVSGLVNKVIDGYNSTLSMINGTLAKIPPLDEGMRFGLASAMAIFFSKTKGPTGVNNQSLTGYFLLSAQVKSFREIVKPLVDGEAKFFKDITAMGDSISELIQLLLPQ